ncbi:MAG: hypothetical protein LBI17_01650 [Rickettsiales bacterium]|nr:hypothetical protein [Rickettsiales bacterium]
MTIPGYKLLYKTYNQIEPEKIKSMRMLYNRFRQHLRLAEAMAGRMVAKYKLAVKEEFFRR